MKPVRRAMTFPNPDLLLFLGMADAYTGLAKFDSARTIESLAFTHYPTGSPQTGYVGQYTSNTQTNCAIVETFFRHRLSELADIHFARQFMDAYQKDPRPGYDQNFEDHVLKPAHHHNLVVAGERFFKNCLSFSSGNEAAVRAIPLGILAEPQEVLRVAKLQAQLTHNSPGAIFGAQLVALMSHFALYESAPLSGLPRFLKRLLPAYHVRQLFDLDSLWGGPVDIVHAPGNLGIATAHAVYTLLVTQKNLLDIVRQTLAWGGDIRATACIAWGIASARYRSEALPDFFRRDLEDGLFGKKYLAELGAKLMA